MKKINLYSVVLISAALSFSNDGFSQTSDRRFSVGVHTGLVDYNGDLNGQWLDNNAYRGHFGMSFMYSLNPWLNLGVSGNYGHFGYHVNATSSSDRVGLSSKMFQANTQLRLKMNNGVWLEENSKLQPFIFVGTGFADFREDKLYRGEPLVIEGTDWTGNFGVGATYMFTDFIGANYTLNYALTNHDKRDGISNGINDQFMQHSLGVVFNIGSKKEMVDSDGDGIADHRDQCYETPASVMVDRNGCPLDADKDGVADYMDVCPDEYGIGSNKGCPEIGEETSEMLLHVVEGIQFETGNDILLESSFENLDAVVNIMKDHPEYKLKINGHTDNVGDPEFNMNLSQARAESVKRYLESQNIEGNRLTTTGFGETQPIETNETPEGRAKNRRVDFEIYF